MKTFKAFVTELFDSHLPYKKHDSGDPDLHVYTIHHEHGKHMVMIHHHQDDKGHTTGHVAFMDKHGDMGVNGEHKTNSHKILGTVRKIVTNHAKEHNLHSVHFDAAKSDRSRAAVYSKMVNRSGGKSKESDAGSMKNFNVTTSDD